MLLSKVRGLPQAPFNDAEMIPNAPSIMMVAILTLPMTVKVRPRNGFQHTTITNGSFLHPTLQPLSHEGR